MCWVGSLGGQAEPSWLGLLLTPGGTSGAQSSRWIIALPWLERKSPTWRMHWVPWHNTESFLPKTRNKRQSLNKTWPNTESLLLHLLMIHYWLDDCFKVLNEFKLNLLTVTQSFSKFTSYIFTMELNVPLCCRMTNFVAVSNFKLLNRCSVSLHWITQIVSKDYCLSSLLFCITNKNIFSFSPIFFQNNSISFKRSLKWVLKKMMEYYCTVSSSQDMITEDIFEAASLCNVRAANIPKENPTQ